MSKNITHRIPNPSSTLKPKKGKSQYKFLPIQKALAPPDVNTFPDAFMNVLDYVKLCISKTRYLEVEYELMLWASTILDIVISKDKAKFEELTEEYIFRLKLIVPSEKFDLIKPKFDELFEIFARNF